MYKWYKIQIHKMIERIDEKDEHFLKQIYIIIRKHLERKEA